MIRVAVAAMAMDAVEVEYLIEAERLGVDSVWVPEMWGYDALTPLAYLAARTTQMRLGTGIVQLGSRTPALLAMSAMSLQALSGGRFLLGLGTSGPQVMEGWHGVRFESPITTTREAVEIVRKVCAGERLTYDGQVYKLPLPGGSGRAIRSMAPAVTVPIYLASIGPRNLELTGELADGWIGNCFMPETADVFLEPLAAGAGRSGRTLAALDMVIPVAVEFTDDEEEAALRHARGYAFTIGAMGGTGRNFYSDSFARQGYAEEVHAVQQLWSDGHRDEAAAQVPVDIGRRTNLLGTPATVKERLRLYRDAGIGTVQAKLSGPPDERLETLETLIRLCAELDAEGRSAAGKERQQ